MLCLVDHATESFLVLLRDDLSALQAKFCPARTPKWSQCYYSLAYSALTCFRSGTSRHFEVGEGILTSLRCARAAQRYRNIARLPAHQVRRRGSRPNLVGAALFVSLLLSSAQHIRAPVVGEILHNFPATSGRLY